VDSVARLEQTAPPEIEVKRLAGRIVWLRDDEREWVGPAEVALALVGELEAEREFWAAFGLTREL
jgi:hypothetical protein